MGFFRRQGMLLLSPLFLILFEIANSSAQDKEDVIAVTIPRELESVSIRTVIETTDCSATCGLGSKVEKRCLVDRSGIREDCEVVRIDCLINWLCGMQVYTLKVGDHFTMDCQLPPTGTLGGSKIYNWKIVRGMVSSNDNHFRPLKFMTSTIVFESIQEENAGTYRCDVQREDDMKLVKRIYFGVRIINPDVMDIDYETNVIGEQKRAEMREGLTTQIVEKKNELNGKTYTYYIYVVIGSAVVVLTSIVAFVLILCTFRSKKEDSASEL